tara:strand:+ start:211 stop:423 length:213 start_codon:yes stop_codon:yes gene_type:complete
MFFYNFLTKSWPHSWYSWRPFQTTQDFADTQRNNINPSPYGLFFPWQAFLSALEGLSEIQSAICKQSTRA